MKCGLILFVALCFLGKARAGKIINCYFGTWAGYRTGDGKFEPANIDPFLCTHVSYTFFGINTDGEIKMLDEWNDLDSGKGGISKTIALKKQNPNLKVLAVVGGWNEYSSKYSSMAGNAKKRARFISSSIEFIQKHGFDGLDLDWEYPAQRDGSPKDRVTFVTLLKELKAAFKPHNLILGIAVAASEQSASISYDIPNISKHLDFINVMTYDFAGVWSGQLGFNAPLRGSGANNIEASIKYWLEQGAPPEKLILGIAFYGRSFTTSALKVSPGSPIIGAGTPGKYTRESGYLGYNEICEDIHSWTVKWDNEALVPYAFKGNQWVGYDDVKSIGLKMDFVKSMNLGGAMIWSIETDDFRGNCGDRYPLLKSINNGLGTQNNHEDDSSTDGGNVVQTTSPPNTTEEFTTAPPDSENDSGNDDSDYSDDSNGDDCDIDGYFVQDSDCRYFYRCYDKIRYDFQCPDGLLFDQSISSCNWDSLVSCNNVHSRKVRSTKYQAELEPSIRKTSLKGNIDNTGNCITDGFFANLNDCGKFIVCSNGTRHDFDCPTGLQFDDSINSCTSPAFIKCTANQEELETDKDSNSGVKTTIKEPYATIPPETGPDGNSELQSTAKPPLSITNEPPRTFPPNDNSDCKIDGYFVNPQNCEKFFVCHNGLRKDFDCPDGLYFDESTSTCNWPYLVNCNVVGTTVKPSSTDEPSATIPPETGTDDNSEHQTTEEPNSTDVPSVTIPPETVTDDNSEHQTTEEPNSTDVPSVTIPPETGTDDNSENQTTEEPSSTDEPSATIPPETGTDDNSENQTTEEPSSTDEPSATIPAETVTDDNSEHQTTEKPSSTDEPPRTFPPNDNNDCKIDGYFVNPQNCEKFFVCHNGLRKDFDCPDGLYFDESTSTCNWPYLVNCNVVGTTVKPSSTDEPSATIPPETGTDNNNGHQTTEEPRSTDEPSTTIPPESVTDDNSGHQTTEEPSSTDEPSVTIPPETVTDDNSGHQTTEEPSSTDEPSITIPPETGTDGNNELQSTAKPSTTNEPPRTFPPNDNSDCKIDGYFVNPQNCEKFFVCHNGLRKDFDCPDGLYFDESTSTCNWPYLVNCNVVGTTVKPSSTDEPSATIPPETGTDDNSEHQTTEEPNSTDVPSVTIPPETGTDDNSENQTTGEPSSTDEPSATIPPETGTNGNNELQSTAKPSTTNEPPRTFPPNDNSDCKIDGYFVNPQNCEKFFVCHNRLRYDFDCPDGLYFDESISTCNWPYLVNCLIV